MHPSEAVLNDFADGALGASDRIEVERHLSACGECRRLVDDFREVRRRAASLDLFQPPPRVWRRIERDLGRARLQSSGRLEPRAFRSAKPSRYVLALAAAAVLVLAVLVG